METLVQTKDEILMRVPIEKIVPDPDQPRKTFNREKDQELFEAIKQKGIIQSLLLRPHKNGYMIVCGERRFHNAKKANLVEVPAIVRNFTDEEARVIQHMENIQREDVNPMEQAISLKVLIDKGKKSIEDISIETGKTVYFIRQNIKLNDLIPKWQRMVSLSAIPIKQALYIARLPISAQQELYNSKVSKEDEKSASPQIYINTSLIEKYQGFLSEAAFNVSDTTLCSKAGACIGCPFNTASVSLYPEDVKNPRCTNLTCFNNKTSLHIEREINNCKEDPSIPFIYKGYGEFEMIEKLKSEGCQILKEGYGAECKLVEVPEQPNEELFLARARKNGMPNTRAQKEFKDKIKSFNDRKIAFDKMVASGKYVKAFMVEDHSGNSAGKYVYIELTPIVKKTKKVNTKKDGVTPVEIQNEIKRINDWDKLKRQKDQEHIQVAISKAFIGYEKIDSLPLKPLPCDTAVINHLMLELLPWHKREKIFKILKTPDLYNSKSLEAYYNALLKLTKTQITFILRHIFLEKYSTNMPNNPSGYLFRMIAEQMKCFPINEIKAAQAEKAKKREANMKVRISVLQEQKAELLKKGKVKPTNSNMPKIRNSSKRKVAKKAA
ncbi:ParB/RepB/Spo0J family partition protein [Pseudoflavitalea rhizosphaerae]|uniref:ParB/RepB/Spo0J family partition protein n=1 Tax=Pseudoflavitalea rhizosphaerae TaxID=1884793 RepID=UPI000F8D8F61|nr:ParB/RepB/Spo0J family partition protein [Pseudoflavitalea rhizosphaerae]